MIDDFLKYLVAPSIHDEDAQSLLVMDDDSVSLEPTLDSESYVFWESPHLVHNDCSNNLINDACVPENSFEFIQFIYPNEHIFLERKVMSEVNFNSIDDEFPNFIFDQHNHEEINTYSIIFNS